MTEVSFDALLPNVRYPFAEYPGGFRKAEYYLTLFERLKLSGVFQLVVSRRMPGGNGLHGSSLKVSIEDYETKEDAGQYGTDVMVSVSLKQFRNYGTKTCQISGNTALIIPSRETSGAPSQRAYTVQEGESLWELLWRWEPLSGVTGGKPHFGSEPSSGRADHYDTEVMLNGANID